MQWHTKGYVECVYVCVFAWMCVKDSHIQSYGENLWTFIETSANTYRNKDSSLSPMCTQLLFWKICILVPCVYPDTPYKISNRKQLYDKLYIKSIIWTRLRAWFYNILTSFSISIIRKSHFHVSSFWMAYVH